MNKPQWIVAAIALLLTLGLYAITQDSVFGHHPKKAATVPAAETHEGHDHAPVFRQIAYFTMLKKTLRRNNLRELTF